MKKFKSFNNIEGNPVNEDIFDSKTNEKIVKNE